MKIIIGVSDARVSADSSDVLATYSLGSCIGVTAYDPVVRIGGLLHFQLPSGSADAQRAAQRPLMFADTGMAALLRDLESHGAQKKHLKIKLAGGAQMLNDAALFNIGKRNHAAIRKVLWQHGLFVEAEAVGGTTPRSLFLSIATGALLLKSGSESFDL